MYALRKFSTLLKDERFTKTELLVFSVTPFKVASHAGVFRGARISSLPQTAFVGREEIRAPLKTPAWEATFKVDQNKNQNHLIDKVQNLGNERRQKHLRRSYSLPSLVRTEMINSLMHSFIQLRRMKQSYILCSFLSIIFLCVF